MKELSRDDVQLISGGFKLHFDVIQSVFAVIGATILGGPVGGGVALCAIVAGQGAGELYDMSTKEFWGK